VLSVTEQTKGLLRYPYGCAEQTTSKAWPFLLEHPELEALQSNALAQQPNGDDVAKNNRELIAEAVRRLKNMQKESGGFGLWDSYGEEQYWLTLYITEFLNRAKLDYPDIIPEGMLEQAYDRIRDYLNFQGDGRNLLVKAYAAYLLSEQGLVSYSDLDFDGNEYMTELTKLHIAAAFNNVGATNTAKLVLESATVTRNPSVYHNDYGSDLRDLSLGILLLNKLANNAELRSDALALQADYIEAVATRSAEDNWLSTQERAALLRAAVLTENKNSQQPLHVALNGESLNRTGAISQSLNTDTKVSNQGQDPIYLKVLAQGYMQAVQYIEYNHPFNTIQVQHGRDVRRQWLINGKPLPASQADTPHTQRVNIGDRITVLINIKLDETINNALIVDRIPAGFVLENPNLGQGVSIENGDDRFSHSNHSEYRHDRYVVSVDLAKGGEYQYGYTMRAEVQGEYTVPPLFIEAMYRPEKHYIGGRAPSDANQQHRVIVKALP
jgi:uncharacterized protein YfaS (alpha-2-macroglobulin family)